MQKIEKRFVATRDSRETNSSIWVKRWPLDVELKKIEGQWVSANGVKKIDGMGTEKFKRLFGFTPRAGSKKTVSMTIRCY